MVRYLLAFLAGLLLLPLGIYGAVTLAPTNILYTALHGLQINTLHPKVYFRVNTDVYPVKACWYADRTRIGELLSTDWTPVDVFISRQNAITGSSAFTPEDLAICNLASLPSPTPYVYHVAPNATYTTRPMFSEEIWLTKAQWVKVGDVEVGVECAPEVIRKTTVEYHRARNASGVFGLTVCK